MTEDVHQARGQGGGGPIGGGTGRVVGWMGRVCVCVCEGRRGWIGGEVPK